MDGVNVNAPITPWVVAGRIISIIGMGFTSACAILLAIIPEWLLAGAAFVLFFPFLMMIVLVERYSSKHGLIGPPNIVED